MPTSEKTEKSRSIRLGFWAGKFCLVIGLHPQKLTWNLEMMVSNRNLLFQGSIFRFHVCFVIGCTWLSTPLG